MRDRAPEFDIIGFKIGKPGTVENVTTTMKLLDRRRREHLGNEIRGLSENRTSPKGGTQQLRSVHPLLMQTPPLLTGQSDEGMLLCCTQQVAVHSRQRPSGNTNSPIKPKMCMVVWGSI